MVRSRGNVQVPGPVVKWSARLVFCPCKCYPNALLINTLFDIAQVLFILSMMGQTDLNESMVVCESVINVSLTGFLERCLPIFAK